MRDLILLVGVIAALAVSSGGQDAGDARRMAIRKVIEKQQAAWNRQDLEGFMAGYWNSAELTFFSGAHESKGWQAALDRYKKNYQGAGREMGKLEFANLRIEMLGPEAAFVRGGVSSGDVGWEDAARPVHARLPQVSRRMEDCPRSLGGRVRRAIAEIFTTEARRHGDTEEEKRFQSVSPRLCVSVVGSGFSPRPL